jgi:hypothetical protein
MTKDEQARKRLVEIALHAADGPMEYNPLRDAFAIRHRAGFRDPSKGPWSAAGLTAAMEDAGLLVPAPGTPARRRAIALLDWLHERGEVVLSCKPDSYGLWHTQEHQQTRPGDIIAWLQHFPPDPAGWRRGHVAVIVAVDDESITTVGWNEGPKPGRVMMRRLWRDFARTPLNIPSPLLNTVLWRRPGGLYGIARPVAA